MPQEAELLFLHVPGDSNHVSLGLLLATLPVALQPAELLLCPLQLRPQRLVGQPQLGVLRLRLQLLSGPGLQLLFQLPLPQPRAFQLLLTALQLQL